jgi:hypothetical protein
MNINTSQEILRLRNTLQSISNISYSFSKLNQKYPIDTLSEEQGQQIILAYNNLISDAKKVVDSVVGNALKDGSD